MSSKSFIDTLLEEGPPVTFTPQFIGYISDYTKKQQYAKEFGTIGREIVKEKLNRAAKKFMYPKVKQIEELETKVQDLQIENYELADLYRNEQITNFKLTAKEKGILGKPAYETRLKELQKGSITPPSVTSIPGSKRGSKLPTPTVSS